MPELKALSDEEIYERIRRIDDERCFVVAEALRRGISIDDIHDITKIDKWFLCKINNIVKMEKALKLMNLLPACYVALRKWAFH